MLKIYRQMTTLYLSKVYQQKIRAILGRRAIFPSLLQNTIQASTIARLGIEQLQKKYHTAPRPLVPSYIRASDAEKMRSNR